MTQASLFQYIIPTAGPDAHPLYQMTSREWRDRTPLGDPACLRCREMLMHDRKGGAEDGLV